MYTGPGPGPMLAAAEAWDGLAADLGFASTGYGATLAELTSGNWIGPASTAMMAAVAPYVNWLSSTAAQAEETANQARAAAAAYEAAFAMTVPPPAIAANRALLMALIAPHIHRAVRMARAVDLQHLQPVPDRRPRAGVEHDKFDRSPQTDTAGIFRCGPRAVQCLDRAAADVRYRNDGRLGRCLVPDAAIRRTCAGQHRHARIG